MKASQGWNPLIHYRITFILEELNDRILKALANGPLSTMQMGGGERDGSKPEYPERKTSDNQSQHQCHITATINPSPLTRVEALAVEH